MVMGMVGGEMCNEDMGEYDDDCETRCEAAYAGGQAYCFIGSDGIRVCRCNYKCPQGGKCRVSLGVWGWGGSGCRDSECNDRCVSSHPGGHGYCYTIEPYTSCFCDYPC
ncbi:hypothetical protein L6164_011664 [Bauhinia variegata]|uniref:Uncharacterized protein n=1 Tax=Bauhinia variegata TaxID=167791 RepID=A0ACB9PBX4_BAUVA|nr:hypothetical protein L6164_011664 [Bauhinia variegata]